VEPTTGSELQLRKMPHHTIPGLPRPPHYQSLALLSSLKAKLRVALYKEGCLHRQSTNHTLVRLSLSLHLRSRSQSLGILCYAVQLHIDQCSTSGSTLYVYHVCMSMSRELYLPFNPGQSGIRTCQVYLIHAQVLTPETCHLLPGIMSDSFSINRGSIHSYSQAKIAPCSVKLQVGPVVSLGKAD